MSGLLVGERFRPFCSQPRVRRLMGPKPVVGDHQIGFSPDDRNLRLSISNNQVLVIFLYVTMCTVIFSSSATLIERRHRELELASV